MKAFIAAGLLCLAATGASADTGRDLIRICGQSASLCSSDFQDDQITALLKANSCIPSAPGAVEQPVVDWLGKHPKTARRDMAKAVGAAISALWPCKK